MKRRKGVATSPCTAANARDALLVALTVGSGAVDAVSYFVLGKIFSAFMTGNIVFPGFGIANMRGPAVVPVALALTAFALGSYLGLRTATLRRPEPKAVAPRMSVLLAFVATWRG
jgi:uncharacterized membrane protein YoaK (UPF0700 family)